MKKNAIKRVTRIVTPKKRLHPCKYVNMGEVFCLVIDQIMILTLSVYSLIANSYFALL